MAAEMDTIDHMISHSTGLRGALFQAWLTFHLPGQTLDTREILLWTRRAVLCAGWGLEAQLSQCPACLQIFLEILCVWENLGRDNEHLSNSCYLPSELRCHHYSLSPWRLQVRVFIPQTTLVWDEQPAWKWGWEGFVCLLFYFVFSICPTWGKLVLSLACMGGSLVFIHMFISAFNSPVFTKSIEASLYAILTPQTKITAEKTF